MLFNKKLLLGKQISQCIKSQYFQLGIQFLIISNNLFQETILDHFIYQESIHKINIIFSSDQMPEIFILYNSKEMYFFNDPQFSMQLNLYQLHCFHQFVSQKMPQNLQIKLQEQGKVSQQDDREKQRNPHINQPQILYQTRFEHKTSKQAKIKKRDQDQTFSIRKQKVGRNTHSNTLRYFLKHLDNLRHNSKKVQEIAQKLGVQSIEENFFEKFSQYVVVARHYAKPAVFKDICQAKTCPKQFARAFRILLRGFLKQQISLFLLRSNKLKKKAKMAQIDSARKLINIIFGK